MLMNIVLLGISFITLSFIFGFWLAVVITAFLTYLIVSSKDYD